jgi:hypothetical protein
MTQNILTTNIVHSRLLIQLTHIALALSMYHRWTISMRKDNWLFCPFTYDTYTFTSSYHFTACVVVAPFIFIFPTRHYLVTTHHFTYLHCTALFSFHYTHFTTISLHSLHYHFITLTSLPYPLTLHYTLRFHIASLHFA